MPSSTPISPYTHSNSYSAPTTAQHPQNKIKDPISTIDAYHYNETAGIPSSPLFSPPSLPSPSQVRFTESDFIRTISEIHDSGENLLGSFQTAMKDSTAKIKDLSFQSAKKLQESAERTQESGVWGMLKKIGSCLLAAISIVFGASLTASGAGTLVGAALIASGIISIANFAMTETGSWDWIAKKIAHDNDDLRQKLSFWVPTVVGVVASIVSIAGSAGGLAWGGLSLAQKAMAIVQGVFGIYNGITTIGKGVSDARLLLTQADLQKINSDATVQRFIADDIGSSTRRMVQEITHIQEKAERVIELCIQANQKAMQPA